MIESITNHIFNASYHYFGEAALHVEPPATLTARSSCLLSPYRVATHSGIRTVVCKQPKSFDGVPREYEACNVVFTGVRHQRRPARQNDPDPLAASMAQREYASLVKLDGLFAAAPARLRVIRPLDLIPQYNAILTEEVPGAVELYRVLRGWSTSERDRWKGERWLRECGRWVGFLHSQRTDHTRVPRHPSYVAQLAHYEMEVKTLDQPRRARGVLDALQQAARIVPAREAQLVYTGEGVEVRNFIWDRKSLHFLDPGFLVVGSRYEDLAKFIASLATLYWGGVRFLVTDAAYARNCDAFLSGYQEFMGAIDRSQLRRYLVKVYIRLWLLSLKALQFRSIPRPVEVLVHHVYIQRFFSRKINLLLKGLQNGRIAA